MAEDERSLCYSKTIKDCSVHVSSQHLESWSEEINFSIAGCCTWQKVQQVMISIHIGFLHKDDKLQGYSSDMGRNTNAEKGLGKSQNKP